MSPKKKSSKTASSKKAARKARARKLTGPKTRKIKVAPRRMKKKDSRAARKAAKAPKAPAAKKTAAIAKKTAAKKKLAPGKPRLEVVRSPRTVTPAPAPEPQAFAEAKASASTKDLVLFELVRAHVALTAAIQGMSAGSAEQPTEPGKWSTREMVLHVAYWDRESLPILEDAYQHGKGSGLTLDVINELNPAGVAELSHHDWDSAKRLLQLNREKLMAEFQSIPEEPAEMWTKEHPVGKLARILTHHDRHHADKIKTARSGRGE